jgi:hypothetical protein
VPEIRRVRKRPVEVDAAHWDGSTAGPCCTERHEATVRGYGEEWNIRARCPGGVSFADWVRGMRGPAAAITITPGRPGEPRR